MAAMAGGMIGSAAVNGLFNIGTTAMNNSAQRDIARLNNDTSRYIADKQYTLGNDNLKFQVRQYDQDWSAARDLGLYHPSQMSTLYAGNTMTVGQRGNRGLISVPRATRANAFTFY